VVIECGVLADDLGPTMTVAFVCVRVCVFVCACACVCVRERERERERECMCVHFQARVVHNNWMSWHTASDH
jgi:aspartate-semialdehyde dehydrogenase